MSRRTEWTAVRMTEVLDQLPAQFQFCDLHRLVPSRVAATSLRRRLVNVHFIRPVDSTTGRGRRPTYRKTGLRELDTWEG